MSDNSQLEIHKNMSCISLHCKQGMWDEEIQVQPQAAT